MDFKQAVAAIIEYSKHVRDHTKEAGRVTHFANLLHGVFNDDPKTVADYTQSMERGVTYLSENATIIRRGRIDALVGHVIMEFKVSLASGRATAKKELRQYAVGLCRALKLEDIPFVGIATDGLVFERYLLSLPAGKKLSEENIEVALADTLELKPNENSAEEFYWFLHRNLMQQGDRVPTPHSFVREFGPAGPVFGAAKRALEAAYALVENEPDVQLARSQWSKYLQYSYGSKVGEGPEGARLFLKHTYLAGLAKFMVWAAFQPKGSPEDERELVHDVISGEFFLRMKVRGSSDRDVFHWVLKPQVEKLVVPMWLQLLHELKNYKLKDLKADILKVLYETLVDPSERHDLGEYYTPDWLCRAVVDDIWPEDNEMGDALPGTLDPTCGSGSFLVALIHRAREALSLAKIAVGTRAYMIADKIVGFDIHPLAVIVAKANYMLALGDLLQQTQRVVFIPVFMADTLIDRKSPDSPVKEMEFEGQGHPVRIGDPELETVMFPEPVDQAGNLLFDELIDASKQAAEEFVAGHELSAQTLERVLERSVYYWRKMEDFEKVDCVKAVGKLGKQMGQLAKENRDTIWAWVARNFTRPYLYERRFKYIVGNPPWLSFRFVTNPKYKEKLERLAISRYGVCADKSSLRTQTELATTFMLFASHTFLQQNFGYIAMVLPRAVFSGDQHAKFRAGPSGWGAEDFRFEKVWDLAKVFPLFNVPTCVIFARAKKRAEEKKPIAGKVFEARFTEREPMKSEVSERLKTRSVKWHLVKMGERTAWSENEDAPEFSGRSYYADKFFQGATIVPRNAFFVRVHGGLPKGRDQVVSIDTDPEQARTAKEPWKSLVFKGEIQRRFLFKSALAKHLLPFTLDGELPDVVLPLLMTDDGSKLRNPKVMKSSELRVDGFLEAARYFESVEKAYAKNRKGAASERTPTVQERLDYNGGLTRQEFGKRYVIGYNHSGTNIASSVVDCRSMPSTFVIDVKWYGFRTNDRDEASYLCVLLNAPSINDLIKPYQSRGLQGERDIHKKVLEVPFPKFDPNKKLHTQLAELGEECAEIARKAVSSLTGKTVGARRSAMRVILAKQLAAIDELLPKLIKGM
ncbi:MAG: N-6 DNA methylase [Planctomycetes bacterium]|nr:N-6 DNA methylase [Planctomycetota bacterium]